MLSGHILSSFLLSNLLPIVCLAASVPPQRIAGRIEDNATFILPGNTRPAVARGLLQDEGKIRGSERMPRLSLHFSMTPAQNADLGQLLAAQQDRRSPQYHKFLTPEQYAARFGLNPADLAKVSEWLEQSGFSDVTSARGGMWISFTGTAAQVESAFHVSIHQYALNGQTHFANTADPQLPKALSGMVSSIRGLHNFALQSHARQIHPQFNGTTAGSHYLVPDDWATIYDLQPLYGAGVDGSGVTIAIAGQSDIQLNDLRAFRAAAGLSAKDPSSVVPPGSTDPGIQSSSGDEGESDLDLEWSGGIARNANILFVTASATQGNGVDDAITYVVDNNSAPILSISYGECEADEPAGYLTSEDAIFQQASAEGITVLVASGDAGATLCDAFLNEQQATHGLAVDYPASSQYVTGVGGTRLVPGYSSPWNSSNNGYGGSANSYIPEQAWNDGFQAATGGGASSVFAKPSWQTGAGVPADNARDVPDLAFTASGEYIGYLLCYNNSCTNGFYNAANNLTVVGGTSASTPSFAGLLALVIQSGGGNRLGNINTNLYSLAQISPNAFHDITSGSNTQQCQLGTTNCTTPYIGYYATTGYDLTTGLGSVDGYNFAQQWFGDFSLSVSPNTLTIQPGTSGTAMVSVVPQNNFSGPVTFSCSVAGTLVDVTCSVPSTPVSGAGGSATVTITAATTAGMPWWKRLRPMPPVSRNWMLALLAMLIFGTALYCLRKDRTVYQSALYAFSFASLVAIAAGAVSCGGGGGSTVSLTPTPAVLTLTCNLPNAVQGSAYSGSCTASGGTAPYKYGLLDGSLPGGVTINATTGVLSGTVQYQGGNPFVIEVSDSGSPQQSAQVTASVIVGPAPLTISCQLPAAVLGVAYSGSCTVSNSTAPLHFSISSGSLPSGLSLNSSTGAITGTPLTAGNSSFVVQVTDSETPAQTATYTENSLTVTLNPLVLTCTLPGGATNASYGGSCSTTGGTPPITDSISAGSLPPGVTLSASGGFIGVPTNSGTSSFTVTARDSGSPVQTSQVNGTVTIVTGGLSFHCSSFAYGAKVAAPYSDANSCATLGGNQPYTYSISSGSLPPGLSLNGASGLITGVPTTAGTSSFTIQVTDSGSPVQTATVLVSPFNVQATAALSVTCPAITGPLAVQYVGICPIVGGNSPYTATVVSGTLPPGVSISTYSGIGFNLLQFGGDPTAIGTSAVMVKVTDGSVPAQSVTIPVTLTVTQRLTETGLVTITATSGGITNTTTISVTVP